MKVLLFGRTGQVGSALAEQAVAPAVVQSLNRADVDLADSSAIDRVICQAQPDVVINAAAYTAVDRAESEPDEAYQVNAKAPGVMAQACLECQAVLVHYSTDYVFDGRGRQPYVEDSPTGPTGVYARSKLAGELAVMAAGGQAIILRTGWVYSHDGRNFLNTMLRLAESGEPLSVVVDQVGSPTYAPDLATATWEIIDRFQALSSACKPRIFHATNHGKVSWHGFASALFERLGRDDVVVEAITTAMYPTAAPRPAYSVLSNERLDREFGVRLPSWEDAMVRCLDRLRATEP
jgi:dTDP-4-dehydrorhamnose reductase